jgi:serine/threonine protein kinase
VTAQVMQVMSRDRLHHEKMEDQVKREIAIQHKLQHKNILKLYGFFYDDTKLYIVLELATGGELYKQLKAAPNARFPERQTAEYIAQLVQALHHCQKHKVIHRCGQHMATCRAVAR